MNPQDTEPHLEISRRALLAAAGVAASPFLLPAIAGAAPTTHPAGDPVATPPVAGLHLQFGADASSEMVVSWHTLQPVRGARVLIGLLDGKLERVVEAKENKLHGFESRAGRLRLSCESRSAARRYRLSVWGPA